MNNRTIFYFIIILSVTFSLSAQEAKEGMTIKKNNYQVVNEQTQENIQSWKEYNDERFYSHPDFGLLPSNSPEGNIVEDLSKRTEKTRYFINIDNPSEFHVQKGYFSINYLDSNGLWRAIETKLVSIGNNTYESKYYYEPAGFDLNQNKSYIKTQSGQISFNQWTLYKKVDGQIEFLAKPNWSDYSVGEDGVYVKNIFDGIDAEMKVRKGSIETDFIMKSNAFGVFDELIFRDSYQADQSLDISFSSNSEDDFGIGNIDIKKGGNSALTMHEGVGYLQTDPAERTKLMYAIKNQMVDVIVPFKWIDENIESTSLVIDPLVTGVETTILANIIGSMYSASCNFNTSCNYDMIVVFPPYATVTNTTTDFDYETVGTCVLDDGATRFLSGSCVSPGQTNFYWFCNLAIQGSCTGTQIPIYNDVSACMPAPSCTPQDIPFQLQFFRSCFGSTGCADDCIAAASDWVVNVTGQTVNFNNLSNTIDLSETQICLGDTIIATSLGTYGVPQYTYNWSFSPTGVPSVGTSSTEDIVLTSSGTQWLYVTVIDDCNQIVFDSIEVEVEDTLVPSFPPLGPYCMGDPVSLPTTSDNGITGSWSPALSTNTLGTNTYTFTSTGCSPVVVRDITVLNSPYAEISGDTSACEGDTILPQIIFTGENTNAPYTFIYVINGDTMQISTSNNEDTASVTIPTNTTGVFNIELIMVLDTSCSRDLSSFLTVTIYDTPIADFTASSYNGQSGDDIYFQNNSSGENAVEWYHYKDSTSFWGNQNDVTYVFNEVGDHEVTLIARNDQCESSITKIISILPNAASYNLPNVFTPNGDGINDVLDFHFDNVKELDFIILNRWGNIIYQTNEPTEPWNGKIENSGAEVSEGTYFYKFTIKGLSGDESEEYGFVHLHRN
jgi:gliding motility-associated-like protein